MKWIKTINEGNENSVYNLNKWIGTFQQIFVQNSNDVFPFSSLLALKAWNWEIKLIKWNCIKWKHWKYIFIQWILLKYFTINKSCLDNLRFHFWISKIYRYFE